MGNHLSLYVVSLGRIVHVSLLHLLRHLYEISKNIDDAACPAFKDSVSSLSSGCYSASTPPLMGISPRKLRLVGRKGRRCKKAEA